MYKQIMGLTNDSLIDTVFEKFPEKKNVEEQGDDIFVNWNFQDFQDGGYLNFKADRSDLFALSIMIENYASKHTVPLLASFETDKRYEFVKDRYLKMMKNTLDAEESCYDNSWDENKPIPNPCEPISCDEDSCSVTKKDEKRPLFSRFRITRLIEFFQNFYESSKQLPGRVTILFKF